MRVDAMHLIHPANIRFRHTQRSGGQPFVLRDGCAIISDPGVIPVKFRAPGGTVCELVPKGRYRKPKAAAKKKK